MDVIKLTALYTAANGREFLGGLVEREKRNPQFDFLKPTHQLFSYFTSLVDAYAKVLNPSAEIKQSIATRSSRMSALEAAVQRWDWGRNEDERKKRENAAVDAERSAFLSVDWFDFTVVETIDFNEDELLDAAQGGDGLVGGAGVGRRASAAAASRAGEDEDMDMDMEDEDDRAHNKTSRTHPRLVAAGASSSSSSSSSSSVPDSDEDMEDEDAEGDAARRLKALEEERARQAYQAEQEELESSDLRVVTDYVPRLGQQTLSGGAAVTTPSLPPSLPHLL